MIVLLSLFLLATPASLPGPDDLPVLPALNEEQLGALLQENEGNVLLVNFWATWCGPCREEFPDFVRLYNEFKDQGLSVVTISMDEPEDHEQAAAFLKQQNARFSSYIRGFEDFNEFVNAIAPEWSGALPATFLFDRDGESVFTRVGKTSYEELNKEITPIL